MIPKICLLKFEKKKNVKLLKDRIPASAGSNKIYSLFLYLSSFFS